MEISKFLSVILASLVAGILGGLAAFSYLIGNSSFYSEGGLSFSPVRVTEKLVTTIQENKALKDAVAKAANIAVGIKVTGAKGAVTYGSGVILTSDGLVAVPYSLFPPGASAEVIAGGKKVAFEVVNRDKEKNLAILKLENSNWPTASFYQFENLKLGERIFLAGTLSAGGNFVNEGVVRDFTPAVVNTGIVEKAETLGSPAFDIEGNIVGIAVLDKTGWVSLIPITVIKSVSEL